LNTQTPPLVVVGGGTAGWLTALFSKQYHPEKEIVLVASEEIGILGAGEGTVPHFLTVLEVLNIPPGDIIKHCRGTIKLGINFVNWNGDGTSFWHGFNSPPTSWVSPQQLDKETLAYAISNDTTLDDISLSKLLFDRNKVPFVFEDANSLRPRNGFAMHFDAHLLAKYLKQVAISRGIRYIDDKIVDVVVNDAEYVTAIHLANNPPLEPLFVFDCSGLSRLVLGKKLNAEWVSYKDTLLCNRAMPFFIPHNDDVAPSTHAIAMNHGWAWKIPVQGRYGCGYVFDDTKADTKEIKAEIESYFGIQLDSDKSFSFSAGCYRTPLKNNCLALGLAHSFLEPMEATSIWCTCVMLNEFFSKNGVSTRHKLFDSRFNKKMMDITNAYRMFVLLHYKTPRRDTEFWRAFAAIQDAEVDARQEALEHDVSTAPVCHAFDRISWSLLFLALDRFDKTKIAAQISPQNMDTAKQRLAETKEKLVEFTNRCISHKQFLALAAAH
jgi:tryptophan halogenase